MVKMNSVLAPFSQKDSTTWLRVRKAGLDLEGQIHRERSNGMM